MARPRFLTMEPDAGRQYDPIQPHGTNWRGLGRRIGGPILGLLALLAKLGALAKFGILFVAFGGYALLYGWKFGLGVIALLFCHEMGHWLEAKREGLNPTLPVFIPFLGAYVTHTRGHPWQTTRVAIAGPIVGGLSALAVYLVARSDHSALLFAIAYFGFFLNLINLLPVSILDGGQVWRATRWLWLGGGRTQAMISGTLYVSTAILLVLGMWAAYVPQHRL